MKTALLIILSILLLPSIASAEKIKVILKPGGATCNHVAIKDLQGNLLSVIEQGDLTKAVTNADDKLTMQIKYFIQQKGITDINTIKTELEKVDFDTSGIKK